MKTNMFFSVIDGLVLQYACASKNYGLGKSSVFCLTMVFEALFYNVYL